jgi:hypothetical protein
MYQFTILAADEEIGFDEADTFEDAKEYALESVTGHSQYCHDELTFSCLSSKGVISRITGPLYF